MYKQIVTHKPLFLVCCLYIFSTFASASENAQAQKQFSFAVVPQQSATTLANHWVPILRWIENKTGYILNFQTAPDIPTFEARLASGQYDFAYMNPLHYVTYNIDPGYRAFAHQSDKKIKGILVKPRGSNITSLKDLSGKTIGFPSPAAFAASVLPRGALHNEKIPITPKYVGSHDSVYRAVAKGLFAAGGGIERTFNALASDIRDQLEIWWTSTGYTPHAFAAHQRIEKGVVERIANAMNEMHKDEKGAKLLSRIKFKGIQSAKDSDWNDIRDLNLTTAQTGIAR